jgi:23S rRNA (cytidine1920-2'-O)/16S rRNA (cytidine1409-2'-O)-methyltransferase
MEKTNARYLSEDQVPEAIEFVAMDVSFISATLVLPNVLGAAFKGAPGRFVVLVKPQFEVGREHVGKGGIVRDEGEQQRAVEKVQTMVTELKARRTDVIESPITGVEGNREFLLYAEF